MNIQEQELDYLKNENNRVHEENDKYANDLHLKAKSVEEYAKKQFEQNKKIKLL